MEKVAYSEVIEILDNMNEKDRKKIPEHIYNFFAKNQATTYVKHLRKDVQLSSQNIREDTKAILALLLTSYLCDSEEEKKELIEIYNQNEKKYEQNAKYRYDISAILNSKKTKEELEKSKSDSQIVEYEKKGFFRKIIDKIKKMLIK